MFSQIIASPLKWACQRTQLSDTDECSSCLWKEKRRKFSSLTCLTCKTNLWVIYSPGMAKPTPLVLLSCFFQWLLPYPSKITWIKCLINQKLENKSGCFHEKQVRQQHSQSRLICPSVPVTDKQHWMDEYSLVHDSVHVHWTCFLIERLGAPIGMQTLTAARSLAHWHGCSVHTQAHTDTHSCISHN